MDNKLMKKLFSALLVIGLLIPSAFCADITTYSFGNPMPLPKTGQTTSYQSGDDGAYQKGSASNPEFVDNGDGTISDKITGLMWVKTPQKILPGASVTATNQTLVAHSDWVTGHAYIIGDLVRDFGGVTSTACNISAATAANPCVITVDSLNGVESGESVVINSIVGDMGTTVLNGNRYYVTVSGLTMTLYTNNMLSTGANTTGKTYTSGGTATQAKYYVCAINHTSGTLATDVSDGKMVETIWTASASSLTTARRMTWSLALVEVEALVYAGYSDWYLPNAKQLQTIVNYQNSSPAINATFFPNTQSDWYWSGSTYKPGTSLAWYVSFYDGPVSSTNKAGTGYVRPCRSSK
jgi:hypothetical protein